MRRNLQERKHREQLPHDEGALTNASAARTADGKTPRTEEFAYDGSHRGPDRRFSPAAAGGAGARAGDSAPTRSPRTPTRTGPPCAHRGRTAFKGKLRNR